MAAGVARRGGGGGGRERGRGETEIRERPCRNGKRVDEHLTEDVLHVLGGNARLVHRLGEHHVHSGGRDGLLARVRRPGGRGHLIARARRGGSGGGGI